MLCSVKDFNAIFKTGVGKIKSKLGYKTEYAKFFKDADIEYYEKLYRSYPLIHEDIIQFLKSKNDVKTA